MSNPAIDQTGVSKKSSFTRFVILALGLAYFASGISNSVISLLAVDIAQTFLGSSSGASVGITSQLNTFNSAATVAFAIMLSFLAIRFRHKPLFLLGIIFVVISAVGSFFAPTLLALQLFYAMEGGGSIIIWIMASTIIGDFLPKEKKAKAIGYLISIGSAASLVTVLLVGFVTNTVDWRANFLLLALPVSILGLIIASVVLPSKHIKKPVTIKENPYFKSLKQVLSNKSATACLITNFFTLVTGPVAIYSIAFYRTQFAVPREWTTGIYEVALIIFIVAPLISGRLVNKFGAKRLAITSFSLSGIFLIMFFFVSNVWIAFALDMLHVWFGTFAIPPMIFIVLEQIPNWRGTMMSLNSLFNNIGKTIAPAIGGSLLVITSGFYGSIGIVFGGMTLIGVVILIFLVKDNTKT